MSTDTTSPSHEPEAVLDRLSHGVISVDDDWVIGYANESAVSLLDCSTVEDVLGAVLWEVCPSLSDSALAVQLRAAAESGESLTAAGHLPPADRRVSVSVHPSEDGLTVLFRSGDGSPDREGEEGEDDPSTVDVQFESLVREVEEYAIFMLEPDGTVATWNEGARKIKGYEAREIIGEHFSTFYTDAAVADGVPEENLQRALEEGQAVDEGWRVRADGSRFWAKVVITAIFVDGVHRGFSKVTRDMTERREREEKLRRERDFSDRLLEAVPVGVTVIDEDGECIRQNRRAGEQFDDDTDRTTTIVDHDVYDESDDPIPPDERPYMAVFETGEPVVDWHCRVETDDGRRWFSVNAIPFYDADQAVEEVVVATEDITDLKRRQRELESELTGVFERVSDAFFALDRDWRFSYVNEQAADLLGHSTEELEGEEIWDVYPEAVGTTFQESYERAMDEQVTVSFEEFYPPLGSWFEVNAYPSESGLSVYFDDITERKERELELEQYETIVATVNDGIYVLDSDSRFVTVNDAFCELVGHDRERLLGEHASLVTDDENVQHGERIAESLSAGEGDVETIEEELRRADGETIVVENRVSPYSIDEETVGRIGTVRDVTERKEREQRLERYHTIVETITDGVYVVDRDGRFTMVNSAYAEMTGYDREQLLGEHVSKVVDREAHSRARAMEAEMRATDDDEDRIWSVEAPVRRADGSTFVAEAQFALLPEGEPNGRIAVVRDISERKEHERELRRRVRQQELIADLGRRALEGEDLDELFDETVTAVADVLDVDYCKVLELIPEADELLLRSGEGWQEGVVGKATVEADRETQSGYTLLSDEPVVVEDLSAETRFSGPPVLTDHDVSSSISVTIGSSEEPWGVLGVHDSARRAFDGHEVGFVQSIANVLATAIDRRAYERALKRYEVFTEESTDVNAILDADGIIRYITPSVEQVLGYAPSEVVGEQVFDIVHPDDRERVERAVSGLLEEPDSTTTTEIRLTAADGETLVMEASGRNLLEDPYIEGLVTYTRDVTEREERERALRDQRDQLSALAQLNAVVRDVNDALVESTSRDELERQVCERLASSESYAFAWVGELDTAESRFVTRTSAGPHARYLDQVDVPYDTDAPEGPDCGPACMAVRTGEIQVVQNLSEGGFEPWHDAATAESFQSVAAIPISHGERRYGVLSVYSERENAFDEREREVIAQLGETVGHALTALERKEALMTDTIMELEFNVPGFGEVVTGEDRSPTLSLERTIPTQDGVYLLYVSVEDMTDEELRTFFEAGGDAVEDIRLVEEQSEGGTLYEVTLHDPPMLTALTEYDGIVREMFIEGSDARIRVEMPVQRSVREVTEAVQRVFPETTLVRQRQRQREGRSQVEFVGEVRELLTEKQHQALETAYFAGYYDWPRKSSAQDVAQALSVSSSTISQHFRSGHRKLCSVLFER